VVAVAATARRVGRPLALAWRPGDEEPALRRRYLAERDGRVRTRLHGLWLVRRGRSLRAAAAVVGVHERTVQEWIAWYRQGGLAAVCAHRAAGRGRAAWLTPEQRERLLARAAEGAFFAVQDAVAWVATTFGVRYRPTGMGTLLRRLRLRKKVPRPLNPKADPVRQEAWKRGTSPGRSARPASAPGGA